MQWYITKREVIKMLQPNEAQKGSMGLDDQMGGMLSYLLLV